MTLLRRPKVPAILRFVSTSSLDDPHHTITTRTNYEEEETAELRVSASNNNNNYNPMVISYCTLCASTPGTEGPPREARYRCPRCSIGYCSVGCYQLHSQDCTENFYKDNVLAEMRVHDLDVVHADETRDPERVKEKLALLKAVSDYRHQLSQDESKLQRLLRQQRRPTNSGHLMENEEEEEEEDDEEEDEENARLAALAAKIASGEFDLEDPIQLLSQLSTKDRRRFEDFINTSSHTSESLEQPIFQVWTPWWRSDKEKEEGHQRPSIVVLGEGEGAEEEERKRNDSETHSQPPPVLLNSEEDLRARLVATIQSRTAKASTQTDVDLQRLPSLSTLLKATAPSPQLANNLLGILYAYAYTLRLYDGEWWHGLLPLMTSSGGGGGDSQAQSSNPLVHQTEAEECCRMVLDISSVLSSDTSFPDVRTTLLDAIQRSLGLTLTMTTGPPPNASSSLSRRFSVEILKDLSCLLRRKRWVLSALSELHLMVTATLHVVAQRTLQRRRAGRKKPTKEEQKQQSLLSRVKHKLYFFLLWANQHLSPATPSSQQEKGIGDEGEEGLLGLLRRQALEEWANHHSVLSSSSSSSRPSNEAISPEETSKVTNKKPLIQEL